MMKLSQEQVNRIVEKQLRRAAMDVPERRKRRMALRQAGGVIPRVRFATRCTDSTHPMRCYEVHFSNQVTRHIVRGGGK